MPTNLRRSIRISPNFPDVQCNWPRWFAGVSTSSRSELSRENVMKNRIYLLNLTVAAMLAISSPAVIAQQSYPDLKGKWIGPGQSVTEGKTDQWPSTQETGPVFR